MLFSRSSTLATHLQDLIPPAWPASEHISAVPRYDHPLAPLLRPSAAVATAVRGTSILLAGSSPDRCVQPPAPACTAATPWPNYSPWLHRAQPVLGASWYEASRASQRNSPGRRHPAAGA